MIYLKNRYLGLYIALIMSFATMRAADEHRVDQVDISLADFEIEQGYLQRAAQAVCAKPYLSGAIGMATILGTYALASRYCDLPTLPAVGNSVLETIKKHVCMQADNIKDASPFLLSMSTKPTAELFIDSTVEFMAAEPYEKVKKLLLSTALAGAYLIGIKHFNTPGPVKIAGDIIDAVDDTRKLYREPRPYNEISLADHILHGMETYRTHSVISLPLSLAELLLTNQGRNDVCLQDIIQNDPLNMCITGPILEEIFFTYIPVLIHGRNAQYIMPAKFGLIHDQYHIPGKITCASLNYLHHKSLRDGYIYAPIISHILRNLHGYASAIVLKNGATLLSYIGSRITS